MIETIKVVDLSTAKDIAAGYKDNSFTAWISTLDAEDEQAMYNLKRKFGRRGVKHLGIHFTDSDDYDPHAEMTGPNRHDIEAIVHFFTALKMQDTQHYVGVNCFAGIARSSAVAMIGWMIACYQPEVALGKVLAVRPVAWPNERILRLYDELTGTNSQEFVVNWKAEERRRPVFSPYLNFDT